MYATKRMEYQTSPGDWYEQGKFVIRYSDFNILAEQTYDEVDGPTNSFLNMVPLSDGDWLGVGVNLELGEHNYGWMSRISNGKDGLSDLGDTLWARNDVAFPDSQFISLQSLHSTVELPSGSIIAAGYFDAYYSGHTDHGILIKVNQHGCIDTTDCIPNNLPNISSTNTISKNTAIKIYPNPAHHSLHYESEQVPIWDKVELLDITGRVVKTVFHNKEITLSDLPPGLYFLRLWKDEQFWTRRVVRQ